MQLTEEQVKERLFEIWVVKLVEVNWWGKQTPYIVGNEPVVYYYDNKEEANHHYRSLKHSLRHATWNNVDIVMKRLQ